MAEIGRNGDVVFNFCVIYTKTILSKNSDTFRKSHVPVGFYFFIQQSYRKGKFQKGQNDRLGLSSVKTSGQGTYSRAEDRTCNMFL